MTGNGKVIELRGRGGRGWLPGRVLGAAVRVEKPAVECVTPEVVGGRPSGREVLARVGEHGRRGSAGVVWMLVRAARGAAHVGGALCVWVAAVEHSLVVAAAMEAGKHAEALAAWRVRSKARWQRLGVIAVAVVVVCALVVTHPLAGAATGVIGHHKSGPGGGGVTVPFTSPGSRPEGPERLSCQSLEDAFRIAGVLDKDPTKPAGRLAVVVEPHRDGDGWSGVVDLPRECGKTAESVLSSRRLIAAAMRLDETQLHLGRVGLDGDGHEGRVAVWVTHADPHDDTPTGSRYTGDRS